MSCRNRLCQRTANAKNVTQFLTGYNQGCGVGVGVGVGVPGV